MLLKQEEAHISSVCGVSALSLQVLSCLLQEQRVVLFSADWARLTLVAESFLLFLQVRWKSVFTYLLGRSEMTYDLDCY